MEFKKLRAMSACTSAISVSTHYDDRLRNALGVFLKEYETFLIPDPYRSLPTSYGNYRSALYPCYVKWKDAQLKQTAQTRLMRDDPVLRCLLHILLIGRGTLLDYALFKLHGTTPRFRYEARINAEI